ncbi:MAG: hypothetical protein ACRDZN_09230, partial [Acidimicrobiales bacterium]
MPARPHGIRLRSTIVVALLVAGACSGDDGGSAAQDAAPADAAGDRADRPVVIVLSSEGNNLNAYESVPPFDKQTVIRTVDDDPDGLDMNGQICLLRDGSGRFVAGEDTGQPERTPGWGIFQLEGDAVGELAASEVGRLVPTYQTD